MDAVDKAGRDKETAYVKLLKGIEQRRDIDKALFKNEARSSSDPRKAGKLLSYITNMELISASTTPNGRPGSQRFAVAQIQRRCDSH